MAPTIDLKDGRITLTWYDLDEAWEVAEVIKSAGIRAGKVVDQGFYRDGVDMQNLVALAREHR